MYSFDWDPQVEITVPAYTWLEYLGPDQLHQWNMVSNTSGALIASGVIPVPGGLNFVMDNSLILPAEDRDEFGVAQSDIVVTAGRARMFFQQYISSTALGLSKRVFLKPNDHSTALLFSCSYMADTGAEYVIDTASKSSTFPRWNCGCHAVVAHEYGHIALAMIGLSPTDFPGFNEGYADTFSFMLNDDFVFGRKLKLDGTNERNDPRDVNLHYPITIGSAACEAHQAGQLLSGPWVRIMFSFKDYYGAAVGLEQARALFGRWSLITKGGEPLPSCQSAYCRTVKEVLSVSKSDQMSMVAAAFAAHGLGGDACP